MDPRGHQWYYRNILKGQPDGQRHKIQYHDLPAVGNLHKESEEAFSRRSTGEGSTYQEGLRRCIPCLDCGVVLTTGFMMAHCMEWGRRLSGTDYQ